MTNLPYLLILASRKMRNRLDHALQEFDLTAAQFSVVSQIRLAEQPVTAAEIAQRLESDRPTISGIISRLEKKGLVEKHDHPVDRRSAYLQVSADAVELVDRIMARSEELTSDIFSIYSKAEREQLEHLMMRLLERIGE
jgi:MarR family transcriptional regulator for hemolysin